MVPELRVKLGIFGQTAKFGQRPCLFHISNIGIKNKLTKQTVKILMRRLIRSRLIWISTVCECMSEFTWCPNLSDFTLVYNNTSNIEHAQSNLCKTATLKKTETWLSLNAGIMQNILQYFWPSSSYYYLPLTHLFCLFLSGRFTQALL